MQHGRQPHRAPTSAGSFRRASSAPPVRPQRRGAQTRDSRRDGGRLSLLQIGHADRDGLATLFARLSPESRHRRFRSPKRELTPRELAFFTDIDHIHHEAIAAVDQRDGSIVGIV